MLLAFSACDLETKGLKTNNCAALETAFVPVCSVGNGPDFFIFFLYFFKKLITRMHNLSGHMTSHPEVRVDSDGRAS